MWSCNYSYISENDFDHHSYVDPCRGATWSNRYIIRPISHVGRGLQWQALVHVAAPDYLMATKPSCHSMTHKPYINHILTTGRPSAARVSASPSGSGGSNPATALAAGATLARPDEDVGNGLAAFLGDQPRPPTMGGTAQIVIIWYLDDLRWYPPN